MGDSRAAHYDANLNLHALKKNKKSAYCEHWDDSAGLKTLFIASLAGNMMHVKSDGTIRGRVGERGLMKLL